jgi:hypothetical protein
MGNAGDQYHGRPGVTNQDAALSAMMHLKSRGEWPPDNPPPPKPPLTPAEIRVKRFWRALWAVVLGVPAIGFAGGGFADLQTGRYSPFGAFLFAGVFGLAALHQIDVFRRLGRRPDKKATA